MIGGLEVVMILAVIVLLFGGRFFRDLGKGSVEAIKEWKRALKE